MGSRKPEKILVETSPIELCVQAASSHYPLFNWCQQFMSQRHARNTDAETFVLFHIWVPRSLAVGTGKPTSKAIDFRQIQAIARSLVVHTWRSSRKIWKLAQGIYTLGRDPSSGKGSRPAGLGENCNWILRDVLSRRRTVSWWPGSLLCCPPDVTSM